jgi:nicotinamidase-related amidase
MASALVVIDMLNRYEHEDAEPLRASVRECLPALLRVIERARESETLVVYVNDNYGDWSAGRQELVDKAVSSEHADLVRPIAPPPGTPFIAKARHSAFYQTQLEYLLRQEEAERLVLVGQVTEQCILYSALDAYVRHFGVAVVEDAVAAIDPDLARGALRMMERNMRAEIATADTCSFDASGAPGSGQL